MPGRRRLEGGDRLPGKEIATTLADVDVVFPVLHGPFGEDGTVQGLLELANVPYVGAGVLGSALCMDKDVFKAVLRDRGVPVTENITLRLGDEARNPFGYPVFVKPARLGSSVGITKAHDEEELRRGVALAFEHDEKVLVGTVRLRRARWRSAVLGNQKPIASLPGEIVVTHNEWYDYEAKYDEGEMDLVVPARLTDEQILRAQELAVTAFVATDCEGMARADLFVRDDGEVLVNELNTIPGFTSTSVYARLFEASGHRLRPSCCSAWPTWRSSASNAGGSSASSVRWGPCSGRLDLVDPHRRASGRQARDPDQVVAVFPAADRELRPGSRRSASTRPSRGTRPACLPRE